MDTPVTMQVPRDAAAYLPSAFEWFLRVEAACSRFDPRSELRQLTSRIGERVPVSAMLFQAVEFAVTLAERTGGAFDPTVGLAMEARGFDREHRTGERSRTPLAPDGPVSFRDVVLDPADQTITLRRPLVLDLGAVAKGLAIDLAAQALGPARNFAIDAGGDLYLAGCRPDGAAWTVGIRNPRHTGSGPQEEVIDVVHVADRAVCTSGDYERRPPDGDGSHIIDPRTGAAAPLVASVTVIAPTAMVADAVATAAFVLGPVDGIQLCEDLELDALIVSPTCERYSTRGMRSGLYGSGADVFLDTQGSLDDRARDPARVRGAAGRP